jgi:hypothetical protein
MLAERSEPIVRESLEALHGPGHGISLGKNQDGFTEIAGTDSNRTWLVGGDSIEPRGEVWLEGSAHQHQS